MAVTSDNRLGCGRDIDDVWEHADDPHTDHESHCEYCQSARRDLRELQDASQQLKRSDQADPRLKLPRELVGRVLSVARAEVRRGSHIPLVRTSHTAAKATLAVSRQAVSSVLWHASDELWPSVEARRCSVSGIETEGDADVPVAITIDIEISVRLGLSVPLIVGQLRARLMDAITREIGIDVTSINVLVKNVHDD